VTTTVDDLSRVIAIVPLGKPISLSVLRDERLIEIVVEAGDKK
jgi:hypothetical protein